MNIKKIMARNAAAWEDFRMEGDLSQVDLIIDGTGPCVSMQLPNLSLFEWHQLTSFKKVYAFSGGVFAYVGRLAAEQGYLRHNHDEYIENLDRKFRSFHHESILSLPKSLLAAVRKKPMFGPRPLDRQIRYIFKDEFLKQSTTILPENFTPFVKSEKTQKVEPLDVRSGKFTIYDLLFSAASIPYIYGYEAERPYSDAVFAKDYKSYYMKLVKSDNLKVVSTPWKHGRKGNSLFMATGDTATAKKRLFLDLTKLIINVPNRHSCVEIEVGFARFKK